MVEEFYKRLLALEALGEVGNAYCGSESLEADWEVFMDIYEYICDKYEEWPDWANAFIQVYSWQFQHYHEGLETYYENFYEHTDYESVKRAGKFLENAGYKELALGYNQVLQGEEPYKIDEISSLFPDIGEWIDEHEELIQQFYFDVLKTNLRE